MLNYLTSVKKNISRVLQQFLEHIESFIKASIIIFGKTKDLKNANIELAKYHLFNGNITDSIIRLIIIDKIFIKNNIEIKNLLGWAYYLKGNIKKAIVNLSFDVKNNEEILDFLNNSENYNSIPKSIYLKMRDYRAQYYSKLFTEKVFFEKIAQPIYLPDEFIQQTLSSINLLTPNSTILDLGCANGIASSALKNNSTTTLSNIIAVEPSLRMIDFLNKNLQTLYSKIFNEQLDDFLTRAEEKFDLVLSFCSINDSSNLENRFKNISKILKNDGFFALALNTTLKNTRLDKDKMKFVYNQKDIIDSLTNAKLAVINTKKININYNLYTIIVAKPIDINL